MKLKMKTKIKVGDEVMVISGKNKKSKGEVIFIDRKSSRVFVKGVNLKKRFSRPTQEQPKGGEVEIEASIDISNVMYYDSKIKAATKLSYVTSKSGKKVRYSVKGQREID